MAGFDHALSTRDVEPKRPSTKRLATKSDSAASDPRSSIKVPFIYCISATSNTTILESFWAAEMLITLDNLHSKIKQPVYMREGKLVQRMSNYADYHMSTSSSSAARSSLQKSTQQLRFQLLSSVPVVEHEQPQNLQFTDKYWAPSPNY